MKFGSRGVAESVQVRWIQYLLAHSLRFLLAVRIVQQNCHVRTYFESGSHSLNSSREASNYLVVLVFRLVKGPHQVVVL